jgi:hypothetical protein
MFRFEKAERDFKAIRSQCAAVVEQLGEAPSDWLRIRK